tara:strand:+ start:650 stop:1138 length:489 start_codon:yes stop_codon:yes gene_type:complete
MELIESMEILLAYPYVGALYIFFVGACVGSFLNVCIYRLPKGQSVITPSSTCSCGNKIAPWNNLPLISWVLLRGKASCCGASFSFRYFFVEALMAFLFVFHSRFTDGVIPFVGMLMSFLMVGFYFLRCDKQKLKQGYYFNKWLLFLVILHVIWILFLSETFI